VFTLWPDHRHSHFRCAITNPLAIKFIGLEITAKLFQDATFPDGVCNTWVYTLTQCDRRHPVVFFGVALDKSAM
jgi:hypothetical protein